MAEAAVGRRLAVGQRARAVRHLDLLVVGSVAALILMGLLSMLDARRDPLTGQFLLRPDELFNRQLAFVGISGVVLGACALVDYRYFRVYAGVLYAAGLLLLAIVLTPLGHSAGGSQRWISLGVLRLQPSELAKPVVLAALAAYLSERRGGLEGRDVVRAVAIAAPPALLVFAQPDLGTMIVLGGILVVTLVVAGASWRQLVALLATTAGVVALLWTTGVVRDYQRSRVQAFLNPDAPEVRLGEGYNYRMTQRAVGNGGLFGTGIRPALRPGSREVALTALDYVRGQRTDFVFTVVAERMGFVGSLTLLGFYAILLARGLRAASQARDRFGAILAAGAAGYLALQVFVNVGMTVGLVPITGIPLPFVSYGGSSLVSSSVAVGMLLSVGMRRFARPLS